MAGYDRLLFQRCPATSVSSVCSGLHIKLVGGVDVNSMTALCFLSLSAAATAAFAAERILSPPMSAEEVANYIPDGARIETRLDADVNGDGMPDTIFVAASDDRRVLKVMMAYVDEFDTGHEPVGEVEMDVDPLGTASLSVKKGVLLVEDLTGGTTAIQSLYRYRFEAKAHRMRLIGDDVTLYSRTNAHDATEVSTNRLTGVQIIKHRVVGDDGYTERPAQKKAVPIKPIYMEQAPSPAETLGWGG
jgi:hypothetical protein